MKLFESPATRFEASDSKTTSRPSALIAGRTLSPFASAPPAVTLTRFVAPLRRSWTKTSVDAVRVARDEVRDLGGERDDAAIGADRGPEAVAAPLLARRR